MAVSRSKKVNSIHVVFVLVFARLVSMGVSEGVSGRYRTE